MHSSGQGLSKSSRLALLAASPADDSRAAQLAQTLGLPQLKTGSDPARCLEVNAVLMVGDSTLRLQQTGKGAPGPVEVDFGSAGMRHRRRSGAGELLGKALGRARKSSLTILDATAGLGRDAFVLADLGCEVILCEREPVVVELLRAGMHKAAESGDRWLSAVSHRMRLCPGDVRQMESAGLQQANVIYLDPMFPVRVKAAAVKKEMALLQSLLENPADSQDAEDLLLWALAQDIARVIVKRPAKVPDLAGRRPSHRITGKAVRYDVYAQRKLP